VDSPYPRPTPEQVQYQRPAPMPYYKAKTHYKQYGRNVQLMIEQAIEMPDPAERTAHINRVASIMKMMLNEMKRESIPDSVIARHIREISHDRLAVDSDGITIRKEMLQVRSDTPSNEIPNLRRKKHKGNIISMIHTPATQQHLGKKHNKNWKKKR
jgi:hypothetical protein